MKRLFGFLVMFLCVIVFAVGCESMKASKPIVPIQEYEKLLVGRLDANYVGTDNCLNACHVHDKIRKDFEASTMGAQLSGKSGMPLVDCESCHGPGSLAIKGLTAEKVEQAKQRGEQLSCDYDTFINIQELPPEASSLICTKCHTSNATFILHDWNNGAHALAGVACADCHNIHAGADLIVNPRETKDMCFKCHEKMKAEFSLRSHHPINEEKVFCTDCHNPHGTMNDNLLREDTIKETCTKCHGEYEGPFTFEHADIAEDCRSCHFPHGSVNNDLLTTRDTVLCLQCHVGHPASSGEAQSAYYTRCTDCHSTIHGTDLPSPSGKGTFVN